MPISPEVSNLASEWAGRSFKIINNTLSTFSSRILEETVSELSRLPGIGKRTALRLVLHLLKASKEDSERLGEALVRLHHEVKYCSICHNISEKEVCEVCSDPKRDKQYLCIVEDIRDVIAIENTQQYKGHYHILGGIISPMDGIGPGDLRIDSLVRRVAEGEVKEIILALSTTMEGDTTNFFIYRKLSGYDVRISVIARGVSIGDEIEYADEITLGRSIINRTEFNLTSSNS